MKKILITTFIILTTIIPQATLASVSCGAVYCQSDQICNNDPASPACLSKTNQDCTQSSDCGSGVCTIPAGESKNKCFVQLSTGLPIGSVCNVNSECLSNDCEGSQKKNGAGNATSYCDCNDAGDCQQKWGAPASGEWECVDGASVTFDLDYCVNEANKRIEPTLPEYKNDASMFGKLSDALFDTKALQANLLQEVKSFKPGLEIRLPGLTFSDLAKTVDSEGYIQIPWIGEFIRALYNFGLVIVSIVAVVMIIMQGAKIVVSGGESKVEGYKKIGQIAVGLVIAWGSYAILYTINPALVEFKSLKIKYIETIPLDVFDKGEAPTPSHPKALNATNFDALFQSYGNCISVDWHVIKAMAYIESSLDSSVVNSLGFAGLFQTKTNFCQSSLKRYGLDNKCTELTNPELSTAVGTSMIRDSINQIKKKCPNIDGDSLAYFIYIGHQSGQGTLSNVIAQTCTYTNAYTYIHSSWEKQSGGKYADSTGKKRTAVHIATEADKGAKKMIGLVQGMGVTNALTTVDKNKCPLDTASLRFILTVTP